MGERTIPRRTGGAGRRSRVPKDRSVDAALIGLWKSTEGKVRIAENDWQYSVDSKTYAISADGMTLTSPLSPPTIYQRVYGSGQTLVGVWVLNVVDEGIAYVEEVTYRSDGSYTTYWTADGAFELLVFGTYSVDATMLETEERRALVATAPPNLITFDRPFATVLSGSYAVASDGESWILDLAGKQIEYTRVVE